MKEAPSEKPVSIQSLRTEFVKLAAEIVRGTNMPSEFWDDRKWYRSTPMAERRAVIKEAEKAHEQCKRWAIRIRELSDKLGDISHGC